MGPRAAYSRAQASPRLTTRAPAIVLQEERAAAMAASLCVASGLQGRVVAPDAGRVAAEIAEGERSTQQGKLRILLPVGALWSLPCACTRSQHRH